MLARGLKCRFLTGRSRRELFEFVPAVLDESVQVTTENGPVEVALEVHPIGTYGPSIVPFNESILPSLACPITGDPLIYDSPRNILISPQIQIAFPINKAGMPIFLKRWAIQLDPEEDASSK